ncbi:MAG: hypothetical protein IKD53_12960, partial [Clostridia bacterium]|nr:hypothetical protein [Clostridia bacterium]
SQAIVGAYMSDVADDELAGEEGEEGEQPEGTIEIVGPDGKPIEINGCALSSELMHACNLLRLQAFL